MSTANLKSEIHQLVDKVNNDFVLEDLYSELKKILQVSSSGIWSTLTDDQKNEVLESLRESDDDAALLSNDEVMNRYKKWLTK